MKLRPFSIRMNLKPGDVIIVPITAINIAEHYLVYIGNGQYMENHFIEGVRYVSEQQFMQRNKTYKRIRRFNGSEYQRIWAVNRAVSLHRRSYDPVNFNCEHFANIVQFGANYSKQSENVKAWAVLALIGAVFVGLTRRT